MQQPNSAGSVAVVTAGGGVLMTTFFQNTQPECAAPILLKSYATLEAAEELIIYGDFEVLMGTRKQCNYFISQGEDLLDCIPEAFEDLGAYESVMDNVYTWYNYIFKDGEWYLFARLPGNTSNYTPLRIHYGSKD